MEVTLDIDLRATEDDWRVFRRSKVYKDFETILSDWKSSAQISLGKLENDREDDLIAKSRIQTLDQVLGIVDVILTSFELNEKEEQDEQGE